MGVFNLFRSKKKEEAQPTSRFIDDEWLEITAKSKEEAVERACVALNTNASHLEITSVSKDGKKFRARKAVEKAKEPQEEVTTPDEDAEKVTPKREKREHRNRNRSAEPRASKEAREPREPREPREHREPEPFESEQPYSMEQGSPQEEWEEEVEEKTDLGKTAEQLLKEIVVGIEPNATVELYETNKTIRMEIQSSESGLFIGKFGQTLDAIQHVVKKIMELKHDCKKHVVVDAEDYRLRREESLETKARKLAKKARQERRPVSIEPMNAMDRRVVHMALKGEPGIETKSVGEGASRRVLIVPKRQSSEGRGRGRGDGNGRRQETRGRGREGNGQMRGRSPSRIHDSYDVPAHSKSEVFGDNPEEYFDDQKYDDDNNR